MRKWVSRLGLVGLFLGLLGAAIPVIHRVLVVGREPWQFCLSHTPDDFSYEGEGPTVSHGNSLIPFGLECRYGNPVTRTVFYEFSTPALVLGLVLIALAAAVLVLRLTVLRQHRT